MPLDLAALGPQIARLGQSAREQGPRQEAQLATALAALREHAADFARLGERASSRERMPFRAAVPLEPLDRRRALPEVPTAYAVAATDGSQIEPDRHGPVLCHLINVGSALLQYGPRPRAALASLPLLRFEKKDIYLEVGNRDPVLIQDRLLALKRHIAETVRLGDLAEGAGPDGPLIGLQDGTLMLSARGQGSETYVWDELLAEFLECLDRLRQHGVPLASYVSRPRSSDVVNTLRLALCPFPDEECEDRCRGRSLESLDCGGLAGLHDRAVFEALPLEPGERGALFRSSWDTSVKHYGEHQIHFFYLNVGPEVARVEVPGWVAHDAASVGLVQAIVYDQSVRGQGYPRALIEAHEKAVITAGDRRVYEVLIDQALIGVGLAPAASEKERSKRLRSL